MVRLPLENPQASAKGVVEVLVSVLLPTMGLKEVKAVMVGAVSVGLVL